MRNRFSKRVPESPTAAAAKAAPWLSVLLPAAQLFLKARNAGARRRFMGLKHQEAAMKNRLERAGVTEALANLLSELKHDVMGAAKNRGADARESLASVLDDVADKVRRNSHRASSHLREHDSGSTLSKVALVVGIAGLVGILFAAGGGHDDSAEPKAS